MRYKSNFNSEEDYLKVIRNPKLSLKAKGIFAFIQQSNNDYCDFDDIYEVSKDSFDSVNTGIKELLKNKIISNIQTTEDTGVVYIISDTYGNYKIGYAKSFYLRWRDYQTIFPYGPEVINLIKTDKMRWLEKTLHKKYQSKKIRGEWFKLNNDDIEYLTNLKDGDIR